VKRVRLGRKELSNIPAPRRECNDEITDGITGRLAGNPHLSAKKFAQAMGIARSTGEDRLINNMGMKFYRVRLILHTLTSPEKAKPTEMAKRVPAELARYEASNFRFLFT
jgi:hypothetical protein